MASVVVIPPRDQETPRKALLGLALAQGLQGLASTLFTIADRRKEREIEEQRLAQQLMIQQDRAKISQQRMEDMKLYRGALIEMQQQGLISLKEHREATIGLRRDELDERSRHNQTIEGLSAARVGIAAQNAADRRANKGSKTERAKDPTLPEALEDIDRIERGLQPKYLGGVKVKSPQQKEMALGVLNAVVGKKTRGPQVNPVQQFMGSILQPQADPGTVVPAAPVAPAAPAQGVSPGGNSFRIPGVQ
jgi:hypothetical protein